MKTILFIPALILTVGLATSASSDTLKLIIETRTEGGNILAAVYSSADAFEKGQPTTNAIGVVSDGKSELEISDLTPGTYGIALFHDLNENWKLDRNLLGAPNEPFGFSNNPVIMFSAPKFEEFTFKFDGQPLELVITLNGGN